MASWNGWRGMRAAMASLSCTAWLSGSNTTGHRVQRVRQLALGTPRAIVRLLRRIGCGFSNNSGPGGPAAIRVIVKEGTRKVADAGKVRICFSVSQRVC